MKKWDLGSYYTLGGSGRVIGADPVSIYRGLQLASAGSGDEPNTTKLVLVPSLSDDVEAGLVALDGADAAILCAATTSTENADRADLKVDQDAFLQQVLSRNNRTKPTAVLLTAPGAIVATGWANLTDAMALMFMGGQETGHAWADILLSRGGASPSGKLPVTIPLSEADVVPPCAQDDCDYAEGLQVGWRALQNRPVLFPFGHGLSYVTRFDLSWSHGLPPAPAVSSASSGATVTMRVVVRNSGGGSSSSGSSGDDVDKNHRNSNNNNTGAAAAGATAVQLYLAYPASAGEPGLVLRGIAKTPVLAPGATATVSFEIDARATSVWSVARGAWVPVSGDFTAHVGLSSRDLRLSGKFERAA